MSAPSQVVVARAVPPTYTFLSRPPPPPKTRPTAPLPAIPAGQTDSGFSARIRRARSSTTLAITGWAAGVHPGSPEARSPSPRPTAPRRRPSLGRATTSTIVAARASPARATGASFLCLTPSASPARAHFSPTAVPPTVPPVPEIPQTAGVPTRVPLSPLDGIKSDAGGKEDKSAKSGSRTLKSFRSLSSLRKRSKSTTPAIAVPPLIPSLPAAPDNAALTEDQQAVRAAAIAQRKRDAYAPTKTKEAPAVGPLSLHAEAQLAQLVDGGKLRDHANALVQAENPGGIAYKDAAGVYWRDEDEAWEAQHLLAGAMGDHGQDVPWVSFEKEWDAESVSSSSSSSVDSCPYDVATTEARLEDLLLPRLRFAPATRSRRAQPSAQRGDELKSGITARQRRRAAGHRPPPLSLPPPPPMVYDLQVASLDAFGNEVALNEQGLHVSSHKRVVCVPGEKPSVMRFFKFAARKK